jgi:hypothetical protein
MSCSLVRIHRLSKFLKYYFVICSQLHTHSMITSRTRDMPSSIMLTLPQTASIRTPSDIRSFHHIHKLGGVVNEAEITHYRCNNSNLWPLSE